jgi:hypothetical protein
MNQAMQKLTDVNYQTSEQHKEMGKARTEHDQICSWCKGIPFLQEP